MKSFRNKQIQMLVATDVAARGIDVNDITHVVNYQLPDEIETYTHRSGRTGRAGKSGVSMVIVTRSEMRKIKSLERILKTDFIKKDIPSGKEICEIQLFHLVNNVKNTEINQDIETYLPQLNESLEELTKEELIQKFFSVEFTRFSNYYKKSRDIKSGEERSKRETAPDGSVRYFINVGEKDGYDWMRLKDFLKETLELGRDDVFKVDCKESFSFFNTDEAHKEKIMDFFKDFKVDGRFVNVEVSNNTGGGGGRDRGGRGRSRGRRDGDSGGFRGRSGGGDRRRTRSRSDSDSRSFRERRESSDRGERSGRERRDDRPRASFQGRRSRRD